MRSRTAWRISTIALFASLASSCATAGEAPATAYRGTITSGCAPHDAPSTVLRLESDESGAVVSFNLWPPSGIIPPATVEFDARRPYGQGDYCSGPETCEAATAGRVVFAGSTADGQVTGAWTIELQDGTAPSGTFTAEWLTIQALCG
jgi:hypothetical protein